MLYDCSMTTRKLYEAGTLAPSKVRGVFPIRIIREGKGSSGTYTKELLKEHGAAFNNSVMFLDHPVDPNRPDKRSVKDIAGKFISPVEYRVAEDGFGELWTEAKVDARWVDFVEDYADHIGVSIFIEGEGREDNGEYIVESFNGMDAYRSVDFVVAPGAGGKVERMLESLRAIETSAPSAENGPSPEDSRQTERKASPVELAEIGAKLDKVAESLAALTTNQAALIESLKPAEISPEAVDMTAAAEAVVESKLPKTSRKAVFESIAAGVTVEDAIKAESARVDELRKEIVAESEATVGAGRVVEGAAPAGFSLTELAKAGS